MFLAKLKEVRMKTFRTMEQTHTHTATIGAFFRRSESREPPRQVSAVVFALGAKSRLQHVRPRGRQGAVLVHPGTQPRVIQGRSESYSPAGIPSYTKVLQRHHLTGRGSGSVCARCPQLLHRASCISGNRKPFPRTSVSVKGKETSKDIRSEGRDSRPLPTVGAH